MGWDGVGLGGVGGAAAPERSDGPLDVYFRSVSHGNRGGIKIAS